MSIVVKMVSFLGSIFSVIFAIVSLLKIKWIPLIVSQTVSERMPELLLWARAQLKAAVSVDNVGVPPSAVLGVVDRPAVQVWELVSLLRIGVVDQRRWVELLPWLLHVGEAAVVVVDVGVSAAAIGLIDDAAVAHHVDALEVLRSAAHRSKRSIRHVLKPVAVVKH